MRRRLVILFTAVSSLALFQPVVRADCVIVKQPRTPEELDELRAEIKKHKPGGSISHELTEIFPQREAAFHLHEKSNCCMSGVYEFSGVSIYEVREHELKAHRLLCRTPGALGIHTTRETLAIRTTQADRFEKDVHYAKHVFRWDGDGFVRTERKVWSKSEIERSKLQRALRNRDRAGIVEGRRFFIEYHLSAYKPRPGEALLVFSELADYQADRSLELLRSGQRSRSVKELDEVLTPPEQTGESFLETARTYRTSDEVDPSTIHEIGRAFDRIGLVYDRAGLPEKARLYRKWRREDADRE